MLDFIAERVAIGKTKVWEQKCETNGSVKSVGRNVVSLSSRKYDENTKIPEGLEILLAKENTNYTEAIQMYASPIQPDIILLENDPSKNCQVEYSQQPPYSISIELLKLYAGC
ncbi:hypothetical protein CEXT_803091 [Caerostris extrusa]|uniref:Uncharacterized protein n=1 Tax=Caerostris extrusa TaxID=172846 RepID=A0AAV4VHU9_CAEEX|nr:hypothetical protein CEXT_803091 [Caerostris extrusa]